MFDRILIANRGEIARRVIRTCARLGIETVAIYSDADVAAPHVAEATTACRVGPEAAVQSYLDQEAIIEAALSAGAGAIHPGYGFLSENATFAAAVEAAGLVFVGPRATVIEMMGDKARAKALMQRAGVPTVPGSPVGSDDPDVIVDLVEQVGMPALLKPVAGGGGKGMRVVRPGDDLTEAATAACRIATSAFGDGRLLVERFVERPRHVEVQVFGDSSGNVVHLFERECSLQRRHQKVIEEAPAPRLEPAVRKRMLDAAVEGARAIGYTNAGTFEFILAESGDFYFLEVNTRLQVEHPVTEAITGVDLVEWQLRVAAGETLPLEQADIVVRGHAIEARIYAEDPESDFRPSPGIVERVAWPHGVRVDAAVVSGTRIAAAYDPMIAKMIAHGADRDEAVGRLRAGIAESLLLGSTSNLGYLEALLSCTEVVEGRLDTGLVDRIGPLVSSRETDRLTVAVHAALQTEATETSPWRASSAAMGLHRSSLMPDAPMGIVRAEVSGEAGEARVLGKEGDDWLIGVDSETVRVSLRRDHDLWIGRVGSRRWWALFTAGGVVLTQTGGLARQIAPPRFLAAGAAEEPTAVAPLPGVVSIIDVEEGDQVARGDRLAVVEAMKMEMPIVAPVDGVIQAIACRQGASVVADEILFRLKPDGGSVAGAPASDAQTSS